MRIAIAHNLYRSKTPSGENAVVTDEIDALASLGHDIESLLTASDTLSVEPPIKRVSMLARGLFGRSNTVLQFQELHARKPFDVLHVHNMWPLIGPGLIRAGREARVAVVMTLHNYRPSCMIGTHYRDEGLCLRCRTRGSDLPGVLLGCYQGSRTKSGMLAAARRCGPDLRYAVDTFIVLSNFAKRYLTTLGVPPSRIVIKPNPVSDPGLPIEYSHRPKTVLYAGRLDRSKGIDLLLEAWQSCHELNGWRLRIVGDGPLRTQAHQASSSRRDVEFLGLLSPYATRREIAQARCVAVPSEWWEGYPRVIAEAMAAGTPVMASRIGALQSIIGEAGWTVPVGSPSAWRDALLLLTASTTNSGVHANAAREVYLSQLTVEESTTRLLRCYDLAVQFAAGTERDDQSKGKAT